jgi:hypothetical protein
MEERGGLKGICWRRFFGISPPVSIEEGIGKLLELLSIGLQFIRSLFHIGKSVVQKIYRKVNVVWRECKGGLVSPCYSVEMRTNV